MINKFSGAKVFHHLDHVKGTLEKRHMFPVHINVDPTNYCNHQCIWCTAYEEQKEKHHDIDYDPLVKALAAAANNGLKAVTYIGYGEPTLHKRFKELINAVHDMGVDQGIFTNGTFKNDLCDDIVKTFTWVRFSLDAATTETHNRVHGKTNTFDSIIKNIETLLEKRSGPDSFTVGVQFALHQENCHEMKMAANLLKEMGVDYFAIKPVIKRGAVEVRCDKYTLDWQQVQQDIAWIETLADENFEVLYKPYQFEINNTPYASEELKNKQFVRHYKRCYAVNFEWWIRNNLDVTICGPIKRVVGNVAEQEFESILGSEKYLQAIKDIDIDTCYRGCRPHYLNETMHFLEHPDFRTHINFVG